MSPPSAVAGPLSAAGGSSAESRHPKLDGVLYHFYSKSSAVITSTRLTHFEGSEGMTGSSSASSRTQHLRRTASESHSNNTPIGTPARTSSSGSGGNKKPSKWFALEIDDHDVFRDEVRVWRNVSLMLPASMLDGETASAPNTAFVPSMILDVILDTSQLSPARHVLMIDEARGGGRTRRRVRADGQDTLAARLPGEQAPADKARRSIVLESWKLDFRAYTPALPPELPVLYKQATSHFRDVYARITSLPAYPLHQRLKQGWQATLERQRNRASSTQVQEEADPAEEEESSSLLKIGVRLAIGQSPSVEEDQIPITEALGSARHDGTGVTESISFDPVISPIGELQFSVEYRKDVDFFVEDWQVIQSMQEIAMDEDYFKPTVARHLQARSSSHQSGSSSNSPAPRVVPLPSAEDSRSLLSVTSRQGQSQAQQADVAVQQEFPSVPATEAAVVRGSLTGPSAFGTLGQTSGRPVAGLSSLRANPSLSGFSASPSAAAVFGYPATSSGTASPALASALSSEAAFLTHGRRSSSSTGDRRVKPSSQTSALESSTKDGQPPAPTTTGSNPTAAGRPILARAAASNFSRSGSYSPSSPSPLAQQMWAQQNAALMHGTARLSSSPSFRGGFAASISPSLRSVFQTYTPSHSQTSVSSLSRTPPRSLIDGGATHAQAQSHAGQTFADGTDSPNSMYSPRQPTVGPQMIKRYSSTFQYRQGKHGASAGSDAGGSGGSGTGGLYSKSWQARIDQRQSVTARSLGREERSASYSSFSPLAARHSLESTSSADREDGLDDLVRMLESKPDLRQLSGSFDSKGGQPGGGRTGERSTSAAVEMSDVSLAHDRDTQTDRPDFVAASATSFPRSSGYSRSQVDEMLNRMQNSMKDLSTSFATNRSSPASGGAATSSSGPHSQPEQSPAFYPSGRSPATMRSPLSRDAVTSGGAGGTAPPMEAILSGDGLSADSSTRLDASSSPNASTTKVMEDQTTAVGNGGRGAGHQTRYGLNRRRGGRSDEPIDADEYDDDDTAEARMIRSHPGRTTSRGSLELYGGTVHSYDPLEDETAGRLEMAGDEQVVYHGNDGGSGGGVYCPPALHHGRGNVMRSTSAGPLPNLGDEAGQQRQTNYELARNLLHHPIVGPRAASNGRSAMPLAARPSNVSPWRVRGYQTAGDPATTAGPANNNNQPAHYRHGRLITPGPGHQVAGTRSGPTSAGPTSRAGSPLLSD